jgi:hypothetical protein
MCVGTGTAIAIAVAAGTSAASIYSANKQAGSAREAVGAQTTAAEKAADLQSTSAAEALAFTKEQAAQARIDADVAQRGNYDQWKAAQVYQNAGSAARARNINALGAQYGVAARDIPEMEIPEYRSTIAGAAAGPAAGAGTPGTPGTAAAGVPNGDYQAWFQSQVAGKPVTQQTLLDLEQSGALSKAGITLTPANQVGERTKINVPGLGWVRVGFGEGDWVWKPQPVGGAAPAAAPGTVGAAMRYAQPSTVPAVSPAATSPVNPALTVDPYQRRTVRDYFAA